MTPPQLTEVEALELLAQQYGLTGQLSALPGERDRNFQLCLASGEKNTFKVVIADVPLESLKVEIQAMQHLNSELGVWYRTHWRIRLDVLFPREAYRMGVPAGYVCKAGSQAFPSLNFDHIPPNFFIPLVT